MNKTELLQKLIPYRMQAVETLNYALRLRTSWFEAPLMTIHVDGKQVMEGNLNAFTNPAIEAGLVHCRALLEFLGLCEREEGPSNRKKRQPGDVGIEYFRSTDGPLSMVAPKAALSQYDGGQDEAERALLTVFQLTNKGLAHITADLAIHPEQARLLEIASRGIPALGSAISTRLWVWQRRTTRSRHGRGRPKVGLQCFLHPAQLQTFGAAPLTTPQIIFVGGSSATSHLSNCCTFADEPGRIYSPSHPPLESSEDGLAAEALPHSGGSYTVARMTYVFLNVPVTL